MKSKETPWEKRNLGISSSIEYYVSTNDTGNVLNDIWDSRYDYQVLHINSGNVDALISAQSNGFKLLEMNIRLVRNLSDIIYLPGVLQRYTNVLSYRYANANEIKEILGVVKCGEMFLTDKVAMDPFFGKKKAGERYALWAEDVLQNDGITTITMYKNEPIGFEIFTEQDDCCENFIGGVFPKYMNKGLGFAPLYAELVCQKERGNRKVITGVSSNNIPVLKIHELLGYKIETMSYTLVKHNEVKV